MFRPALPPLLLAALVTLPGSPSAGVVLEMETRELATPESAVVEKTRLTIQGRRLLMESLEGTAQRRGDAMLFHGGDEGRFYVLDHQERSYMRMDRERAQAMGGQVASAMDQVRQQMDAQLKSLPAEQRAMVEAMMKQRMGAAGAAPAARPEVEVRRTSERAKKNGHPCRKVEVWSEGRLLREHWVTDCDGLGVTADELGALEEMGAFMEEIASSFGTSERPPNPMRQLGELGGCPVVTVDHDGGRPHRETVVTGATRRTVDAAELELPPGYQEQAMPGLGRRP